MTHPDRADRALAMERWSRVFEPNVLRVAAAVLALWLWRWRHAPRLALWVVITMAAGGPAGGLCCGHSRCWYP